MATPAQPSHSRSRSTTHPPSRPTTPLRPPSRTSLRASQATPSGAIASSGHGDIDPLLSLEPAFAEFSDSMADLEANFMHLQLLNESLARFNENFAAFSYGLNMSAFCVDFPEAPVPQSFARHAFSTAAGASQQLADSPFRTHTQPTETDATFLTTDTSFVENPPSSKAPSKYSAPPSTTSSRQSTIPAGRGGMSTRGRGSGTVGRGARGTVSGIRRSGIGGSASSTGRGRGSLR